MRNSAIAICFALTLPFTASAEETPASTETLLKAALSQASSLQQTQSEPERVRSMTRTYWGLGLVAGGSAIFAAAVGTECVQSDLLSDLSGIVTCDDVANTLTLGLVIAGTGALLATIWSDVPVVSNLIVSAGPRRIQAARSFSF